MKKNIKMFGRLARGVVGLIVIGAGMYYHRWWGALGLFSLAEGILGWCAFRHFTGCGKCDDGR